MIAQCLYQSDPKNLASMGRQRLACQRAARKLQWGVQKERISETNEPVPLLMRPAVKEILQDAEQHRFDVLLIGNRDSLCCDAADMESFLTVLNSFNIQPTVISSVAASEVRTFPDCSAPGVPWLDSPDSGRDRSLRISYRQYLFPCFSPQLKFSILSVYAAIGGNMTKIFIYARA